jgi:hypothetical protein
MPFCTTMCTAKKAALLRIAFQKAAAQSASSRMVRKLVSPAGCSAPASSIRKKANLSVSASGHALKMP